MIAAVFLSIIPASLPAVFMSTPMWPSRYIVL
jgi:hypothetical protein